MGLLRRAEPAGYEDFVASRYREIVRFGALLAGDPRLGEDLAQEGLIAAYRSTAEPRTVYLAARWDFGQWPSEGPPGATLPRCTGGDQAWTAIKTLNRIRTALAELRDPVPAGEECTLQKPGPVGIGFDDDVTVVLGDPTCPQAISTGGGRVRVPAGLGKELLDLILASDRAATARATKD